MINEIIVLLKMVLQKNLDLIKNSQEKSLDEKILLINMCYILIKL